jgi:hypothetical protein
MHKPWRIGHSQVVREPGLQLMQCATHTGLASRALCNGQTTTCMCTRVGPAACRGAHSDVFVVQAGVVPCQDLEAGRTGLGEVLLPDTCQNGGVPRVLLSSSTGAQQAKALSKGDAGGMSIFCARARLQGRLNTHARASPNWLCTLQLNTIVQPCPPAPPKPPCPQIPCFPPPSPLPPPPSPSTVPPTCM